MKFLFILFVVYFICFVSCAKKSDYNERTAYIHAHSFSDQVPTSTGVEQPVMFDITANSHKIRVENNSTIVFSRRGKYHIDFSAQINKLLVSNSGINDQVSVWLKVNNVTLPGSGVRKSVYVNSEYSFINFATILSLGNNDTISVVIQVEDNQIVNGSNVNQLGVRAPATTNPNVIPSSSINIFMI